MIFQGKPQTNNCNLFQFWQTIFFLYWVNNIHILLLIFAQLSFCIDLYWHSFVVAFARFTLYLAW